MSIYGNSVMLGSGGESASIYITGDVLSTDTVTGTSGGKTKTAVWSSHPNPEAHGLPSGYTELDKISATTTQWINANFSSSNPKIEIKMGNLVPSGSYTAYVWGKYSSGPYFAGGVNSSKNIAYRVGSNSAASTTVGATTAFVCEMTFSELKVDGVSVATYSGSGAVSYFGIFAGMSSSSAAYNRNRLSSGDCYYCKLWDGSDLVRDFIPCKRNSDSAVGMYDLVSGTFFGDAAGGNFTAGTEIPSTISGFFINGINEYGTWTVNASRGSESFSQSVIVDTATEYTVDVSYGWTVSLTPKSGLTYETTLDDITWSDIKEISGLISKQYGTDSGSIGPQTVASVYAWKGTKGYNLLPATTTINIGMTQSGTTTNYAYGIMGFNLYDLVNTSWYGTGTTLTKAGICFGMIDCHNTTAKMNSSDTNSGGWGGATPSGTTTGCLMRTSTMQTLKGYMPSACQSAMPQVKIPYYNYGGSSMLYASDYMFLPAEKEIFGSRSFSPTGEANALTQYAYYKNGATKIKKVSGSANRWWERSVDSDITGGFCSVGSDGTAGAYYAPYSHGVAPCFCI